MPYLRRAVWFALALALLSPARSARACVKVLETPQNYQVDPGLRAVDHVPPSAFGEVRAFTYRRIGQLCSGGTCTANSCGNSATVDITFVSPRDDQTASDDLGYRIDLVDGSAPASMRDFIGRIQPLRGGLSFGLAFDEVSALDATVKLVAVDRAGNESAQSQPIYLGYSGCTKPPSGENCMNDGGAGCSVSLRARATGAAEVITLSSAALLAARLRSRRRARARSRSEAANDRVTSSTA